MTITNNIINFLGTGNPLANYWFIGIEENWDLDKFVNFNEINNFEKVDLLEKEFKGLESEIYELTEGFFEKSFYKHKSYYSGVKDIIEIILKPNSKDSLKKIIIGNTTKPSEIFTTNFLPIGKNRNGKLTSDNFVKNVFILELEKYKHDEEKRLNNLSVSWHKNKPSYTFVLMDRMKNIYVNK